MAYEISSPSMGDDLAYDLRQRYAKIVGDHIEDVAIGRKTNDYTAYFKALEDLFVITQHKFKTNKKTKEEVSYKELRDKLIGIANRYSEAWHGTSQEPQAISEIEGALRAMEMWLYTKMDEANMFGSKRETEGLI